MEIAPRIETARLILSQLDLADASQVQTVFPQWSIVEYMAASVPWPYPDDGALSYIRDSAIPAMKAGAEWHWSIRPKLEPGRLIGMVSLMLRDDDNRGFWLDPLWQERGLMREASDAVTDFWFGNLGQKILRVPKASANRPSRAISERSGMRIIWSGERDYVSGRHPAEIWEITADEWQVRPQRKRGS